ncbi:hypothetical protein HLI18_20175 [Rhizobium laguerreae]|uniref:hypothetical protein n=1 Tax=Rhizobium TaxID=379 RepID=UPI0014789876|nr:MULTISPECIES: hypothetical protein [Rhizobium]NNG72145.1 hypothetical protein [Rhizobium laguerreae]UWU29322.1 hypothetical protein N2600_04975 [Rhizobium leguminosarum bv. viciae]
MKAVAAGGRMIAIGYCLDKVNGAIIKPRDEKQNAGVAIFARKLYFDFCDFHPSTSM